MTFSGNNVGIGTTSPTFPLHVTGCNSLTITGKYGYLNSTTPTGTGSNTTANFSIYAPNGRVLTPEIDVTSD